MAAICLGVFLISLRQSKQNAILVFGSKESVASQIAQWSNARDGFAKRDFAIFRATEIRNAKKIEKQLSIQPGDFAVVLVLADGRTALRSGASPLSAERLFEWIDALPKAAGEQLGPR